MSQTLLGVLKSRHVRHVYFSLSANYSNSEMFSSRLKKSTPLFYFQATNLNLLTAYCVPGTEASG